jgi:hypothetical protein
MTTDLGFLGHRLPKRTAVLAFVGLLLPVVAFFTSSFRDWEAEASRRARAREAAMDRARVAAGYPAVSSCTSLPLIRERAVQILDEHLDRESCRLTDDAGGAVVAMSVAEVTEYRSVSSGSGRLRGIVVIRAASIADDGPVQVQRRAFDATIVDRRVVRLDLVADPISASPSPP